MKKELVEKFRKVEKKISKSKGDFQLFALFLKEEAPVKWDLVVAAPWLKRNDVETLKYFADALNQELKGEITNLSGVMVIDEANPALKSLNGISVRHGLTELQNVNLFGIEIKHAYIITSQKLNSKKSRK